MEKTGHEPCHSPFSIDHVNIKGLLPQKKVEQFDNPISIF
jgi:hypothetical protein